MLPNHRNLKRSRIILSFERQPFYVFRIFRCFIVLMYVEYHIQQLRNTLRFGSCRTVLMKLAMLVVCRKL